MNSKFGQIGLLGRILFGFSLLILPILIATVVFLNKINQVQMFSHKNSQVIVPTRSLIGNLGLNLFKSQMTSYEWLLTGNESTKKELKEYWENIRQLEQSLNEMEPRWENPVVAEKWDDLKKAMISLENLQNKIQSIPTGAMSEEDKQLIREGEERQVDKIGALIGGLKNDFGIKRGIFDILGTEFAQESKIISRDMSILQYMSYGLIILVIALAIFVSWLTARNILKPIQNYSKHSARIASGDLTQRIQVRLNDEVGHLGNDLNNMTDSLASLAKKITHASNNMVATLEEVKLASEMQSSGISEQASSINEITASLDEIDKSTNQTLDKAKILGQLAEETSKKGQLGLDSVDQSIQGMHSIREKVQTIAKAILELSNQTQQVGEITEVVNSLALQSKMLALNASIEAAKAGESGKGFAVVAQEVKNLAEQSEQSTQQVQKILEDIRHGTEKAVLVTEEGTKGVDQGMGLVEQMGEIVRSLTTAINETMIACQQIEAAVRQEGLGIEQITEGMNEINQVTTSFVGTVKQTSESITRLNEMAKDLKQNVGKYKV